MAGCSTGRGGVGGTVEFQVGERANLDNLKAALEKIVLRVGTIECGIGGYDFRIIPGNMAKPGGNSEEIAPGIKVVTHTK